MQRIKINLIILVSFVSFLITSCTEVETEQKWTFAVVCDTRGNNDTTVMDKTCINDSVLTRIAASIVEENCELVIVPGDLTNGWWAHGNTSFVQELRNWKNAMSPVYEKNIPVYAVRGNHENGSMAYPPVPPYTPTPNPEVMAAFKEAFADGNPQNGPEGEKGLTYYVQYKNAFFVGLDEYINPYKVNISWLNDVLTNKFNQEETPHLFTYGHDPAFQVTHPDCLAFYEEDRDEFWNLIGGKGSKLYFCGHDHVYNRAKAPDDAGNEIYQALVGSCGAPFKAWSGEYADSTVVKCFNDNVNYGYMTVTIEGKKAMANWHAWDVDGNQDWTVLDSFSYMVE